MSAVQPVTLTPLAKEHGRPLGAAAIVRLADQGELLADMVMGQWLVREDDLLDFLRTKTRRAA